MRSWIALDGSAFEFASTTGGTIGAGGAAAMAAWAAGVSLEALASAGCAAPAWSAGVAASASSGVPSELSVDGSGLSNFCIFCQARRPGVMGISVEMEPGLLSGSFTLMLIRTVSTLAGLASDDWIT